MSLSSRPLGTRHEHLKVQDVAALRQCLLQFKRAQIGKYALGLAHEKHEAFDIRM